MENNELRDFPNLIENENIGFISNFVTEEILSKNLNAFQLPFENFEKIIKTKNINTLFLEDSIYETDHEWFGKNYDTLLSELENSGVQIVVVTTSERDIPRSLMNCPKLIIDHQATTPGIKDNCIVMPIVVDELRINPANNTEEIDIMYFKPNNLAHSDEITEYHNKFKPNIIESNPHSVSREMIKR